MPERLKCWPRLEEVLQWKEGPLCVHVCCLYCRISSMVRPLRLLSCNLSLSGSGMPQAVELVRLNLPSKDRKVSQMRDGLTRIFEGFQA